MLMTYRAAASRKHEIKFLTEPALLKLYHAKSVVNQSFVPFLHPRLFKSV